ncbi:MAG TPA: VWA domain-containing protein [Vicinamibacterales bacterium]|jgi:Ca-activated chloride channel family protein|nr:VWA domain-containing protein [Vicinamibacterales bacterium]
MRRSALGFLVAACVAAVPFIARAQGEDEQVFKAGAELVVLHVNVFNGRSDAVEGLPQKAFTVFEDETPQEISFFNGGDVPVTVGLVIDNSTSMLTERELVTAGTGAFAQSSHPEDEMFAIVFNEHVRRGLPDTVAFTRNRLQLQASLARYPAGGKTALYDAVIEGLNHLDRGSYQKHVLVVLSDGGDNASRHTEKEMLDRVAMSNAIVYTVVDPDVFSPGEGDRDVLKRLAKLSGGVAYFPKNSRDVVKDFEEIAANIRRGYSIGYVPPAAQHVHNQTHRVKVLVRAPGHKDLSVRVRREYMESE